jgi:IclR family acetate operon transcriptional repressor
LAFLPPRTQARIIRARAPGLPAREHQRLLDRLAVVRREGMDVSASERIVGALALAGPVWGQHEEPVAALSITGPLARFTPEILARAIPGLKRAVDEVSTALGGAAAARRYPLQAFQREGESHTRLMTAFAEITGVRPTRVRS